jgi:CO/xanthine dehydrogenase Mo-binding subunit
MAARRLNRPVKLVPMRDQGFAVAPKRGTTAGVVGIYQRSHVKMGAGHGGKLNAHWHEAWEMTSRTDDYPAGGVAAVATAVFPAMGRRTTAPPIRNPYRGFLRLTARGCIITTRLFKWYRCPGSNGGPPDPQSYVLSTKENKQVQKHL